MNKGKVFPKDVVEHWPEVFGEILSKGPQNSENLNKDNPISASQSTEDPLGLF